jgi:hypothetical protein
MFVLDYVRSTDAATPTLVVPPFHTGHLGFLTDTPVRVSLVASPLQQRHCEVVVAPFFQEWRYLALVSATMRDEPGVVARLLTAVAALGMNVEAQDSSSVDLLDHHFVNLIVDLSESVTVSGAEFALPSEIPRTPPAVRRAYRHLESILPVHDERFVRLFESIVAHCADVIVWKQISGELFPDISIQPMPERPFAKSENASLRREGGARNPKIAIDLPRAITTRLHTHLGIASPESAELQYILISDTTTRSLRAFFIDPESTPKLFHVGLEHNDVPGALATILGLLRDAKFNILTSLSRKRPGGRAVVEALVEYQGKDEAPPTDARPAHSPLRQGELEWVKDVIEASDPGSGMLACDITVDRPLYPRRRGAEKVTPVALSQKLTLERPRRQAEAQRTTKDMLKDRRKDLGKDVLDKSVARKSEELLDSIGQAVSEGGKSTIFLSNPGRITSHATKLQVRLEGELDYRVRGYQTPDGEVITDEVLRRIEDSDYFIGIWHHEGGGSDESETVPTISPWMLFEYGIAQSARKPTIVVHSNKLDPTVWNRVDPGVARPGYDDLTFESITVPIILEYCAKHFR